MSLIAPLLNSRRPAPEFISFTRTDNRQTGRETAEISLTSQAPRKHYAATVQGSVHGPLFEALPLIRQARIVANLSLLTDLYRAKLYFSVHPVCVRGAFACTLLGT
jgi:hypothetical protein